VSGPGPAHQTGGAPAEERLALISGAASGIGRVAAGRLHELGYLIAGADLRPDAGSAFRFEG